MGEWEWFYDHVEKVVIPNNKRLLDCCRKNGVEVTYGRIASLKKDGSDRSRVQSTVGWNDIYVYVGNDSAKMVDELTPLEDEIVVNKTTDSVSLGNKLHTDPPQYGDRYRDRHRCRDPTSVWPPRSAFSLIRASV